MKAIINSMPKFMWNNIFTVINTLVCGLIVAFFTSTFLKKKEERTRIAGVIVEKRINSEQTILHFLEQNLIKEEININNNNKFDYIFDEISHKYRLPKLYDGVMQNAKIFSDPNLFEIFFHDFENQIINHKLWLDRKVKEHLVVMQLYFSFFNLIPLVIKRTPLPKGKELSDEEFKKVHKKLLMILGHTCHVEINIFMSELDEKIVDSIYKLEFSRPKKSIRRNNMYNINMRHCMKKLERHTIPYLYKEEIFKLIMDFVYAEKGIDIDKMNDKEFEKFLKSSMGREYEQFKKEELKDYLYHYWDLLIKSDSYNYVSLKTFCEILANDFFKDKKEIVLNYILTDSQINQLLNFDYFH